MLHAILFIVPGESNMKRLFPFLFVIRPSCHISNFFFLRMNQTFNADDKSRPGIVHVLVPADDPAASALTKMIKRSSQAMDDVNLEAAK